MNNLLKVRISLLIALFCLLAAPLASSRVNPNNFNFLLAKLVKANIKPSQALYDSLRSACQHVDDANFLAAFPLEKQYKSYAEFHKDWRDLAIRAGFFKETKELVDTVNRESKHHDYTTFGKKLKDGDVKDLAIAIVQGQSELNGIPVEFNQRELDRSYSQIYAEYSQIEWNSTLDKLNQNTALTPQKRKQLISQIHEVEKGLSDYQRMDGYVKARRELEARQQALEKAKKKYNETPNTEKYKVKHEKDAADTAVKQQQALIDNNYAVESYNYPTAESGQKDLTDKMSKLKALAANVKNQLEEAGCIDCVSHGKN